MSAGGALEVRGTELLLFAAAVVVTLAVLAVAIWIFVRASREERAREEREAAERNAKERTATEGTQTAPGRDKGDSR